MMQELNKKAGIFAGLVCWRNAGNKKRSVAPYGRAAPAKAVVHAYGDHVHVLADPIERTGNDRIDDGERIVCVAHKQVVVFDAGRPIRCEAVLPSDAHGATPAGRACRGEFKAGKRVEYAKTIARHRRAALHVEQGRVPRITDLAGEKAD